MDETMATMVLMSAETDCDGCYERFSRVEVPKYLAFTYQEWRDKLDHVRAELENLRSPEAILAAMDNSTYDSLSRQIAKAENRSRMFTGICGGIEIAIHAYLADQDIQLGMGDWFPMAEDDRNRLEDDITQLGGFDLDYWHEVGYFNNFGKGD